MRTAEISPGDLDFLVVSTCTGYLCPGLSTRLIEECGLRKDIRCLDVVGMGCGSAIPAMEQAHNFLAVHPRKIAASVSTEICSAAFYSGDSPDLVVSNAIFADGSAALILRNSSGAGIASFRSFACVSYPEWRETLRFITEKGRLRNVLSKDVPALVEKSIPALIHKFLRDCNIAAEKIDHWVFHAGGEKILAAIQRSLNLAEEKMALSRKVLRQFGNLSSPTILYGLKEILDSPSPPRQGELALLVSFGAGFSIHACLIVF
jgi:alkylresorcinol/alkylpyrone synthase